MNSSNDPLVLIFSRNAFYKRLHILALFALVCSGFVILVLLVTLIHLLRHPTHPLYFAADEVGRLIQVIPVNVPNMSTDDVITWTTEGLQAAYSYDYINYRKQLQNAQKYFTSYGWSQYMKAVRLANNIPALIANKQVVLAQVVDKPKILAQGILSKAYAWKFEVPMLITYSVPPYDGSAGTQYSNAINVTVIVQRQPALESDEGLGIVQVIS